MTRKRAQSVGKGRRPPMRGAREDAPLRVKLVGFFGALLLRLVGATWRVRYVGEGHFAHCVASGKGFVHVFWHGQLLPLSYFKRNEGAIVLVSRHRDGEMITQVIERLGYGTARGSTSRGGFRAIIEMAQLGRRGVPLAITPDGPRGPRMKVQPGTVLVAQRGGLPILPVAVSVHPARRLASWDRFIIPHLFAKVVIGYGEPFFVPDDLPPEAAVAEWAPRVEAAIESVHQHTKRVLERWRETGHAAGD